MSLLFLVVFAVILLNLGSIRENLDEHIEPRVMIRGKCPEGCDYSNMTDRTGKKIESCSRRDGTKCNLLDKCLPGDVEKDGMCQYCEPGLKVVGGKCVPIDTNASLPVMSRAPCKDGEKSINEICLKCPAGKKLDNNSLCRVDSTVAPAEPQEVPAEFMGCPIGCFSDGPMCLKNGGGRCDSKQCPNGQTESMGGCYRNCAAGKKLDNRTCVVDRTVLASESNNTNNTVPPPTRSASTSAPPQQRPAEPQGVPSCDIEKFAAY